MGPGDVAWLVVLGLIGAFELWATVAGQQTMSMSVWGLIRHHKWFSFVVIALLTVLAIHLTAPALERNPPVDPCGTADGSEPR